MHARIFLNLHLFRYYFLQFRYKSLSLRYTAEIRTRQFCNLVRNFEIQERRTRFIPWQSPSPGYIYLKHLAEEQCHLNTRT